MKKDNMMYEGRKILNFNFNNEAIKTKKATYFNKSLFLDLLLIG